MGLRDRLGSQFDKELATGVDALALQRKYFPQLREAEILIRWAIADEGSQKAREALGLLVRRDFLAATQPLIEVAKEAVNQEDLIVADEAVSTVQSLLVLINPTEEQSAELSAQLRLLAIANIPVVSSVARVSISELKPPGARQLLEQIIDAGNPQALEDLAKYGFLTADEERLFGRMATAYLEEIQSSQIVPQAVLDYFSNLSAEVGGPHGLVRLVNNQSQANKDFGPLGLHGLGNLQVVNRAIYISNLEFLAAVDAGDPLSPDWDSELDLLLGWAEANDATLEMPETKARELADVIIGIHDVEPDSTVAKLFRQSAMSLYRLDRALEHLKAPTAHTARVTATRMRNASPALLERHVWQSDTANTHDLLNRDRWSLAAQNAFEHLAHDFARSTRGGDLLVDTLGEIALDLNAAPSGPHRRRWAASLVAEAIETNTDFWPEFTAFVGSRHASTGLRHAVVLADPKEAPEMASLLGNTVDQIQRRGVRAFGAGGLQLTA